MNYNVDSNSIASTKEISPIENALGFLSQEIEFLRERLDRLFAAYGKAALPAPPAGNDSAEKAVPCSSYIVNEIRKRAQIIKHLHDLVYDFTERCDIQ
jgi:hypothetical protein